MKKIDIQRHLLSELHALQCNKMPLKTKRKQRITSRDGSIDGLSTLLVQSLGDTGGHGLVNGRSIHDEVVLAQGAKETILSKVNTLDVLGGRQHGDNDGGLLCDLQWTLGDLDLVLIVGVGVVILQKVGSGLLVDVVNDKVGLVLESVEEVGGHGKTHVTQTNESDSLDLGLVEMREAGEIFVR